MSDHPKTGQDKENVSVNGSQANPHIKSFRIVSRNRQNNIHSIDYSKNLEFSLFPQHVSHAPVSLAHIRPDLQNITPQKIALKDCNPNIYYTQRAPEYFLKTSKEAQAQRQIPVSDSQVFSSETESIRLYKLWPGKNRFFLGGRLMGGPKTDRIANISTWVLILAISIIFFAVAFPYLLEDVTLLLPLISIYLFLSTISFFLLTTFTDPGIIPRKSIISLDNELRSFKYSNNKEKEDLETNSPLDSPKLEPKPNLSNNNNNLKFCHDCNIYKPPKTIHCKYCGNCVSLQYKHFHFVNNCIGRRNYRYFIGFMMSLLLLIICYLTSFLIIIVTAIDPDSDPRSFFQDTDVTIIVILILGIPVAIKIVVILVFLIINLVSILKSRKLTKQQKVEKLALNIETGKVSVNLWATDISLVHPRKLVTKDQYSNFKKQNAEKL